MIFFFPNNILLLLRLIQSTVGRSRKKMNYRKWLNRHICAESILFGPTTLTWMFIQFDCSSKKSTYVYVFGVFSLCFCLLPFFVSLSSTIFFFSFQSSKKMLILWWATFGISWYNAPMFATNLSLWISFQLGFAKLMYSVAQTKTHDKFERSAVVNGNCVNFVQCERVKWVCDL